MNIYFVIIMSLHCMGLGMDLLRHGTKRTIKENFVTNLIARIISVALLYFAIKTGF